MGKKNLKKNKKNPVKPIKKSNRFSSFKTKLVGILISSIIITMLLNMCIILPTVKKNITNTAQNYMSDFTNAYGRILDANVAISIMNLNTDRLGTLLSEVGLTGIDSSYFYVTAANGNVIYHPDAGLIGQPADNSVVSGLVEQLNAGTIPEPGISSYVLDGSNKYVSYYIVDEGKAILILSVEQSEILKPITDITYRAIIFCFIFTVLFGICGLLLVSQMTKPLLTITNIIGKLSDMDLTDDERLEKISRRKDETGVMGRAILALRNALTTVISDIKQQSALLYSTAESLNSSAAETSSTVQNVERAVSEIAAGATNQATETQRASNDILLMGTMVEDTSSQVTSLNDTAASIRSSSDMAEQTLNELDSINQRAIDSIKIIYEQTHTTNESALKIKEATSLISAIADETNLLSLNASIEAARAGEAGRGFAVVASQIQKLAEQSNESAQQIDDIIFTLLEDSQRAVSTMDEVKQIMTQQSENVSKTGSAFAEVQNGIDNSITGVGEIANCTNQLNSARSNVVDVVQSLTAIAEENAASTQETSAAVVEVANVMQEISTHASKLQDIASSLEKNVSTFKL